ncbi:Gfo/Idh/MocA family oxidoreductase [Curtobacterium pusillum]|uniref:Gfo/Idh/MocA family oxidoreductase n=1 Tax=Curtobacterium pusillum TaxID=69373 RepID=A0ABX2MCG8_9MICO|nr:Gfo/Idh/MocA family oxidoreductase [Curtobacterium pusillum]NUU15138.1 Gfo/Idh/MocA family oxidoreductase [Curtobacterium pusillum]GLK31534.1 dehydrogenase [Curtobacterium pusillum]
MNDRIRVAFASGVRHADSYLAEFAADPRVQLVGVADEPDAPTWMIEDGRRVADRYEVPWFDEIDAVTDPERVDLTVVCSEPTRHARLASAAITAGVHVLVDKPVATRLEDLDALIDLEATSTGTVSVVNRTHAPALRRARRWIDAGDIGLPRHVDVEFLASGAFFSTSVERPELVLDPSLSGGGEILNFLGYCVDAVDHLVGLPIESVHAMAGALFDAGHAGGGVEDTAIVSLGLANGVTATATVGRVAFAPGTGPTSSSIRVLGSHGHLTADDDQPAVLAFGPRGVAAHPIGGGGGAAPLRAWLGHVVDALCAGEAPDYGLRRARTSLAAIDAAYRSLADQAAVRPHRRP